MDFSCDGIKFIDIIQNNNTNNNNNDNVLERWGVEGSRLEA